MKAVVFHGLGDIRLDNVPEPKIKDANDAIVSLTASAIQASARHSGETGTTRTGSQGIEILRDPLHPQGCDGRGADG
jgi:threonine dehydrogenase-like Zn-dependent dehydrogenase